MDYSVVVTLGPSSNTESTWRALLAAGATAFRLNTSHLSLSQLHTWVDRLADFMAPLEPKPWLVLDLQGSKWRLGQFPTFELRPGQRVELVCTTSTDRPNLLPVPHPDFFEAAALSSGEIVLNDARVRLVLVPCKLLDVTRTIRDRVITICGVSFRGKFFSITIQTIHDRCHNTQEIVLTARLVIE